MTDHTSRLRFISIVVLIFAVILVMRLFFVQVIDGERYSQNADRQYVAPASNLFDRGSIFFKKKNGKTVSAATLNYSYILAINPKELKNPKDTYNKISNIITIDEEDFLKKANKINDPYEEIAKKISKADSVLISDLDIDGVGLHKEQWRSYPASSMASHALGFVAFNGDKLEGRYGLERYYEDVLSREEEDLYVNFFAEVFSNIKTSFFNNSPSWKGDIVLSIEPSVQNFLEKEMLSVQEEWSSDFVGGIIINPQTGAIYALGNLPDFDLNNFRNEDPKVFSNPTVENVFEMGSIMKPLTMAAAIDSGAVTAKTTYNDKGYVLLDGARIENYDGKGRGIVSMQEVLNQSLNTGVVFAMEQMGKEVFADYLRSYGIGEETGIDLPNETSGLISNLNSNRNIEYATAAFGQGIATTPIGTVRALSVLANGGLLITPHLVDEINYKMGFSKNTFVNKEPKRVLKETTSEEISRILVKVVDEALLGGTVKLPNYSVAAKTGTAQIANQEEGGYYDDRYLHSFFGYFPAYDPEFLVFLYTINPKEVRYASQTLTHPFINLTKFLINYYEVPPDR